MMMTDLTSKLKASKKCAEFESCQSLKDRLWKSFENHQAQFVGAFEIAEARRAEVREKFKDNPTLLKRALEAIDDWLAKET